MQRNSHVRFGERDEETCPGNGIRHFVPILRVIAGTNPGAHLTDLQRPWRRIRDMAGLKTVRVHDLRHTFAPGGLAVGEGLSMIGKLLGHTRSKPLPAMPISPPPP